MAKKSSFEWKNGDVVELADGERGIYLDGYLYCYNKGEETGFLNSWDYGAKLRHYWTKNFDIKKVWRYPDACCTQTFMHRFEDSCLLNAEVIYTAPQKMTLSEVCEALGKDIVIVEEE